MTIHHEGDRSGFNRFGVITGKEKHSCKIETVYYRLEELGWYGDGFGDGDTISIYIPVEDRKEYEQLVWDYKHSK